MPFLVRLALTAAKADAKCGEHVQLLAVVCSQHVYPHRAELLYQGYRGHIPV